VASSASKAALVAALAVFEYGALSSFFGSTGRVGVVTSPVALGPGVISLLDEGAKILLLAVAGWICTYATAWHERMATSYYRESRDREQLETKLAQAQLQSLRYQLNPHFLFNTLNAISTLILDSENRTANQAVMRLSEFLRYTLDQDPMKKVTLRQEIEAMNLYLTTEKLRFGERLRLEFAVEERALEALVPSLLLQPLIENAVKFAVSPSEMGGLVRDEGRARGSMLELVVCDDGPGLHAGAAPGVGRGVGLRNTRERLAVLYTDNHRFATLDNKPGLRIEVGLPLEMAAD
jgi:LytS/YehU family sensor histidine kinase